MATNQSLITVTLPAGADLSSDQYKFVKMDSTDRQVILCSAATDRPIGILQNAPSSGSGAEIAVGGISKLIGSGNVSVGNLVTTDANGLGLAIAPEADVTVATATWSYVAGIALETDAAANAYVTILLSGPSPVITDIS